MRALYVKPTPAVAVVRVVAFLVGVVPLLFQFTFLNDMVPSMVFVCSSATYFIFLGVVLF